MNRPKRTQAAQSLRKRQTDAETVLWRHLHNRDLGGHKFRRQVPLGPYVVDLVCFDAKLIVEADGGQHADSARDQKRDAYFRERGYRVLRLWNADILKNIEGALTVIEHAMEGRDCDQ
ncbi:MAG: DUF559 domain-containing protein [Pseudomonadota bacterium]